VERVCDDVYTLPGDGGLRHLPGGVEQYLEIAAEQVANGASPQSGRRAGTPGAPPAPGAQGAQRKAGRRELARVERELDRAERRDAELQTAMAAAATDAGRLHELTGQLGALSTEREELEARWLALSEELEES
jgi:ATP-binding cassette subfamily F protein uup